MKHILSGSILAASLLFSGCSASQDNITPPETPIVAIETVEMPTPSATVNVSIETETKPGGNADVVFVRAVHGQDGSWTFHVTVSHPDMGWDDYADGWDAVLPDGTVLKAEPDSPFTRLLLHPHQNEQPFTRSQGQISVPENIDQITFRAHDLVDGFGGREITVDLNLVFGEGFSVEE